MIRNNERFRVASRYGENGLIVKEAPGWRIVARCSSLQECAAFVRSQGVDPRDVPVTSAGEWKNLAEHVSAKKKKPARQYLLPLDGGKRLRSEAVKPPRKPKRKATEKARQRWHDFQLCRAGRPGLTFREYLKETSPS